MRKLLGIPLAVVAALTFTAVPASASTDCPSSVATIKALQGGGSNTARTPDSICQASVAKALESGQATTGKFASQAQLWPEKEAKLRQQGLNAERVAPTPAQAKQQSVSQPSVESAQPASGKFSTQAQLWPEKEAKLQQRGMAVGYPFPQVGS